MEPGLNVLIEKAKKAALEVLLHNNRGPFKNLPRTAGWGYPEPYTRDLMISSLGVLVTGNETLINSLRRVFQVLAKNQTRLGHIPSIVHDPKERG
ncbi:MAG: amylo-alpha-1,6-glucosidase, partial [Proteobacteria bacterium]|nr:amylo-alpha-1,6-glucosidase [Pseudomonadota bacterium]